MREFTGDAEKGEGFPRPFLDLDLSDLPGTCQRVRVQADRSTSVRIRVLSTAHSLFPINSSRVMHDALQGTNRPEDSSLTRRLFSSMHICDAQLILSVIPPTPSF